MRKKKRLTYAMTGVNSVKEERSLNELLKWINKTHDFRKNIGGLALDIGYFANVINLGNNTGIAVSTDGVGTKLLIAQMMDKYDTVGIDCVAMNVNDIICVGAEPITMLDYLAVQEPKEDMLEEIGKGLYEGARIAKITISGGEVSQIREIIRGKKKDYGFDLVGTAIGTVSLENLILGQEVEKDDVIIGLRSTGVHSNGLTLARKALLIRGKRRINEYIDDLGRILGEELLEPTHIYAPEVKEMIDSGLKIKALANITSDGFLNLSRINKPMGYVISEIPEPQPIFNLIQKHGNITDEEMYRTFNMGIGFCVICEEKESDKLIDLAKKYSVDAYQIGHVIRDKEKKVRVEPKKLIGKAGKFYKY